jgi:hypothetical protein
LQPAALQSPVPGVFPQIKVNRTSLSFNARVQKRGCLNAPQRLNALSVAATWQRIHRPDGKRRNVGIRTGRMILTLSWKVQ